ncbi:MAG: hypothetical protein KF830_01005 [Planctomycetes bacterium]|nr:hypothetical protein [Planctomycetota bacterium]
MPPDLGDPEAARQAIGEVSLRLLAGAVPRRTLEQLQRTVQQTPAEYPWQIVTQAVLAEPVDPQRLVQQGLEAQRDWIVRGGRERPAAPVGQRAKGLLARFVAQAIFGLIWTVVVVAGLLLLKHKLPELDIYRLLVWFEGLVERLR